MDTTSTGNIRLIARDRYYLNAFINYTLKGRHIDGSPSAANIVRADAAKIIKHSHETDVETIAAIDKYLKRFAIDDGPSDHRGQDRARIIEKMARGVTVRCYLDYGCGDGSITSYVGGKFGLSRDNIMGVDIIPGTSDRITWLNASDNLNIQVDLITAFVSLHHIEDIESVIAYWGRILANDGIVIIREHDYVDTDPLMKPFLDAIHAWCDRPIINSARCYYRSAKEWDELFARHGFKPINKISYAGNNPQRLYYASYARE